MTNGPLSQRSACCGHSSDSHVWRGATANRSPTTLYCNTCRAVGANRSAAGETRGMMPGGPSFGSPRGALSSMVKISPRGYELSGEDATPEQLAAKKRAPFADVIADLERGPAASRRSTARSAPRAGAFDRLIDDLRREGAPTPTRCTRSSSTEPAPDPSELVVMFEEDERGNARVVRHHAPRSTVERLTDELLEASKPPPPTAAEVRAKLQQLDRDRQARQHQRRLAELRAARRRADECDALARYLEAACR